MNLKQIKLLAYSAGAAKYTSCISAEGPGYDAKQSVGQASVMSELWGMWSTSSLPLLPVHWPGVVTPDWVLSISQRELNCVLMVN